MRKIFNVIADCQPDLHYMVNISDRLESIKKMVAAGQYFTINRAPQYGKTTTLKSLVEFLKKDYVVINLDFQMISYADFENEKNFVCAFARELLDISNNSQGIPLKILNRLETFANEAES